MLFIKAAQDEAPEVRYVVDEHFERAVQAQIEKVIMEKGIILTQEEANFVRCLKGRCEDAIKQVYSLVVYGVLGTIGTIIVIGFKEWVK